MDKFCDKTINKIKSNSLYVNCVIDRKKVKDVSITDILENVTFLGCKFENAVVFENTKINEIKFINCDFQDLKLSFVNLDIKDLEISDTLGLSRCEFMNCSVTSLKLYKNDFDEVYIFNSGLSNIRVSNHRCNVNFVKSTITKGIVNNNARLYFDRMQLLDDVIIVENKGKIKSRQKDLISLNDRDIFNKQNDFSIKVERDEINYPYWTPD